MALGRTTRIRWWIIGLVMLGTSLNYLSRSVLGVAAPTVLKELSISTAQYSYVTGLFQLGIMLQPLAGFLLDTIGLRRGMTIFTLAWGGITMAHGLATGWVSFAALRGLLGFAEGTSHPGGLKVVAEWFPARERGLAGGIYNIGASFGSMLAAPLVVTAILVWNWRGAFVVAGALAVIWALVWWRVYAPPAEHRAVSEEERTLILEGQEPFLTVRSRPSIGSLLRQRNWWGIALPRFLADPTWGTLTAWMPLYLSSERGFDLKQIALFAWLPFVAADLGCLFGPAVAAYLHRRGVGLIDARRWTFTLGALLMTGMMFTGFVSSAAGAVALLCLGGFAHQTLSVTCITMSSDLFPKSEVGTASGMVGLVANTGVLLFSLAIGQLVTTIGYQPFFVALGIFDLVGAALLWTLVRPPVTSASPPQFARDLP